MSLVDIPSEVWRRVLFDCVTLPELVRFDLAATSFQLSDPADHLFSFDDRIPCGKLLPIHLDKLLTWFKSRNVYLKQIFVGTNEPEQWGQILRWTGRTVCDLTIFGGSGEIVLSAGLFCTNLEKISLQHCLKNNQQLYNILANNATTLRSFELVDHRSGTDTISELPPLQISNLSIRTYNTGLISILSKCADLSALRWQGNDVDLQLANCLASHCKKLKRLHLVCNITAAAGALSVIASGCNQIESLQVSYQYFIEGLGEAVHALPNLKRLSMCAWDDRVLEEIGVLGSPSLRIVEISGYPSEHTEEVSVQGIRALTEGCPNIMVLSISTLKAHPDVDSSLMLEHCAKLRYLAIGGGICPEMCNALLNSAGIHCPRLHTLSLCHTSGYPAEVVNNVLQRCTQLCSLIIDASSDFEIPDPLIAQRVVVTRSQQVRTEKWVAPVIEFSS